MDPKIVRGLLQSEVFDDVKQHVREIRRAFVGTPYHDLNEGMENKFNRWYWHNIPVLRQIHHSPYLKKLANEIFPEPVKPTYVFLSMYGEGGVCPLHTDRPQCKYTIDLCISQREPWEIFVNDKPYVLNENEALAYSGTDHPHYRNVIQEGNFCNLAFFHFVPVDFEGKLD